MASIHAGWTDYDNSLEHNSVPLARILADLRFSPRLSVASLGYSGAIRAFT